MHRRKRKFPDDSKLENTASKFIASLLLDKAISLEYLKRIKEQIGVEGFKIWLEKYSLSDSFNDFIEKLQEESL